jgi:6-phosphogluconate dehydrogenase
MGGNLALQALEKGFRVAGLTRGSPSAELRAAGLVATSSHAELAAALAPPRKIFFYIPSGEAVDELILQLEPHLDEGDIIVDGGNSYWGDSLRRLQRLRATGIHFIDLGTSGGVDGARHGACFMAGGERAPVELIEPILLALAVEGGYVHAGPAGAGHFTKLVHNGIEFGMLQAIGEGMDLLEHHKDALDIPNVVRCWRHGSVIRSWLIDLLDFALREHGGFSSVPGYVDDTGEVNWLIGDALRMEVPIPVIAQSVMQLLTSRDSEKVWARAIAMMRNEFGGHAFGPSRAARVERLRGRIEEPSPEAPRVGVET